MDEYEIRAFEAQLDMRELDLRIRKNRTEHSVLEMLVEEYRIASRTWRPPLIRTGHVWNREHTHHSYLAQKEHILS